MFVHPRLSKACGTVKCNTAFLTAIWPNLTGSFLQPLFCDIAKLDVTAHYTEYIRICNSSDQVRLSTYILYIYSVTGTYSLNSLSWYVASIFIHTTHV